MTEPLRAQTVLGSSAATAVDTVPLSAEASFRAAPSRVSHETGYASTVPHFAGPRPGL